MLVLERQGKAVDDGAENLKQLRHAVVPLCLVNEAVEHLRRALISASYASSAERVVRRVEEGNAMCIEEDGCCLLLRSRSLLCMLLLFCSLCCV